MARTKKPAKKKQKTAAGAGAGASSSASASAGAGAAAAASAAAAAAAAAGAGSAGTSTGTGGLHPPPALASWQNGKRFFPTTDTYGDWELPTLPDSYVPWSKLYQ